MRSTGGAGEHWGALMGVYAWYQTIAGENGTESHVYKQRHDGSGDTQYYIYRLHICSYADFASFRFGQYWYENKKIGPDAGKLRAPAGSGKFPPVKGWEYWNSDGWVEDPTLECGPPLPSCNAVNVELSGKILYAFSAISYSSWFFLFFLVLFCSSWFFFEISGSETN